MIELPSLFTLGFVAVRAAQKFRAVQLILPLFREFARAAIAHHGGRYV